MKLIQSRRSPPQPSEYTLQGRRLIAEAKREERFAEQFPQLWAHLEFGRIERAGSEYHGLASDGVIVNIGNVGDEQTVERYLASYPSPSDW